MTMNFDFIFIIQDNTMIEKIIPDVPHFHNIIADCVEKNKEFEVTQLLLMSGIIEKVQINILFKLIC